MHVRTTLRPSATALVLIAGCHDRSPAKPAAVVVDDRPTAILITTGSDGPADRDGQGFNFVHLALDDSANRAAAARHHVTDADCPVLLCLTPGGVIVSRDGGPVTADLVRRRVATAAADGPAIDGQRAALARAVPDGGPPARLRLAAFLHAHRNEWEAIPPLAAVAHDPAVDVPTRVRAWVDLVRAHQWVGEPEKGRHEAQHLLAALGPRVAPTPSPARTSSSGCRTRPPSGWTGPGPSSTPPPPPPRRRRTRRRRRPPG